MFIFEEEERKVKEKQKMAKSEKKCQLMEI